MRARVARGRLRSGGCFCGAIRFRAKGAPLSVVHCHCLHCRRTSGAAFVTWVEFPKDQFRFTKGRPKRLVSRPGVVRTFCGACGSPLTYHGPGSTESADVIACCFDAPESFTPQSHIFTRRRLGWIHLDDGLPAYKRRRPT